MRLLQKLGYTNARHYHGGLEEWRRAGERVEDAGTPVAADDVAAAAAPAAPRRHDWGRALVDTFERATTGDLISLWLLTIVACALLYWALAGTSSGLRAGDAAVGRTGNGLLSALYFSFVTATSVGFGDIVPLGAARAVAIAEAILGLLVFGAVVSKLVSRRQEQVVREIHRIAFDDRLSRVQADLHMVLAELQAVAEMCGRPALAEAQVRARVDSVSGICLGELRTIHELLYRPESMPQEDVLEGILASLAMMLEQFRELLHCFSSRSHYLDRNLAGLSRLADDICSECVPRRYAPALRQWMDRIQALARQLS